MFVSFTFHNEPLFSLEDAAFQKNSINFQNYYNLQLDVLSPMVYHEAIEWYGLLMKIIILMTKTFLIKNNMLKSELKQMVNLPKSLN